MLFRDIGDVGQPSRPYKESKMHSRWYIGLLLLSLVVILWVISGFLVNAMADSYAKPYFVTYLNTTLMAAYLPWGWKQHKNATTPQHFSVRETAKLSVIFFVLWFSSNLLNNASYYYTTVQSATIISCSSSFFTLIIGSYMGVEKFNYKKFLPLVMLVVGISLVTAQDDRKITAPPKALMGNLFALGSAFLYGVYTSLLKRRVGDESNLNTKLFFGFVGVCTLVGLWPVIFVLHWLGIETFELPPTSRVYIILVCNGAAIMISDFCWVVAMLMTSPLVVSVGLSATMPLSILGEMILYERFASWLYLFGAILVGFAFYLINSAEDAEEEAPALENERR